MAMMAPMKDCTFKVVPDSHSATVTPSSTAGTVESTTRAIRND